MTTGARISTAAELPYEFPSLSDGEKAVKATVPTHWAVVLSAFRLPHF